MTGNAVVDLMLVLLIVNLALLGALQGLRLKDRVQS